MKLSSATELTVGIRTVVPFLLGAMMLAVLSPAASGTELTATDWLFRIDGRGSGPIETVVRFEQNGERFSGVTRSGAIDVLRELAPDNSLADAPGPMWLSVFFSGSDIRGELSLRNGSFPFEATFRDDVIEGVIADGFLAGKFTAVPFEGELPLRDYKALLSRLDTLVATKIYNPAELETEGWKLFRSKLDRVAETSNDDLDFLFAIQWAYDKDLFSHFEVKRSAVPVETTIQFFDEMRTGRESARLTFEGGIAILTVDTMMGLDTIEQIDAAYVVIAEKSPKALIIDVRNNSGGAFAVRPLVSHVLAEPLDAGHFVSNGWWSNNDRLPRVSEVRHMEPWEGWSIIRFWNDVQTAEVLRIRFEPQEPVYDGPVFVVTSRRSASATELAVDAFRGSGRVTIVGEKTAGEMLSASYFDLGEGFIVVLPVADYYSTTGGRIEGNGVLPTVEVSSDLALERAKALASE